MTIQAVTFIKAGRGIVPDAHGRRGRRPSHTVKLQVSPGSWLAMTMQTVTSVYIYRPFDGDSASKTAIPGCL
jgi:hypothetical protein